MSSKSLENKNNIDFPISLQKEGYSIRHLQINDTESLAKNGNDKEIWLNMRNEFPYPFTSTDAEILITRAREKANTLVVAIANEQEAVGVISLLIHNDIRCHSGVLSYWIGREFWGQGIGTNAINTLTKYAFSRLGLIRVYAKVFSTNIGSIRALEKNGFHKEGHFKKGVFKEGEFIDQVLYAKVI